MGLVQKAFSDIITFSRSSNATRIGPDGLVQYAPHNLILQSQTFDNASWTKADATITANSIAAPDGTVTADKIVSNVGVIGEATQSVSKSSAAITYTLSCYAKAGEFSWLDLTGYDGTSAGQRFFFNLSSGVVGSTTAIGAGFTVVSNSIVSVGNGWYRCSCTFTTTATATLGTYIYATNQDGANTVGNGTSGIYIWGAQLSVGPNALDYVPTTSAAVYGPRFDYDPVTLAAKGLLIEEQRSNLLTYSEQFDDASWTKSLATVTANAATAPNGVNLADLLVPTSTSAQPKGVYKNVTASASGTKYTLSIFAKASGKNFVMLGSDNTIGYLGWFNLSTGSVGTMAGGYSGSIQSMGNGWYRCAITWDGAQGRDYPFFGPADADASGVTTINGSDGILIWGSQIEIGAFSTSYIPTLASSVTRSADVASVNTLSPWYQGGTAETWYAEVLNPNLANGNRFVSTETGATPYNTPLFNDLSSGRLAMYDGTATRSFGAIPLSSSAPNKIATAYSGTTSSGAVNGSVVTGSFDSSMNSPTIVYLAQYSLGGWINGHLRRISYFPRRLSDAELQSLTS